MPPLLPLLALSALFSAPLAAAEQCASFAYSTPTLTNATAINRVNITAADSSLTNANITFVQGDALGVQINAVYDLTAFAGLQVSYSIVDTNDSSTLRIVVGRIDVFTFAGASSVSQNGSPLLLTTALGVALASSSPSSTYCPYWALALAPALLGDFTWAALCTNSFYAHVIITLPPSLSGEAVPCLHPHVEYCFEILSITYQPTPSPHLWSPLGCFRDESPSLFLSAGGNLLATVPHMSVELCENLALVMNNGSSGQLYIGLQAGSQCFSTTNFSGVTLLGSSNACVDSCPGSAAAAGESCGGTLANAIYQVFTSSPTSSPVGPVCSCDCYCLQNAMDTAMFYSALDGEVSHYSFLYEKYKNVNPILSQGFYQALSALQPQVAQQQTYFETVVSEYSSCGCPGPFTLSPSTSVPSASPDNTPAPTPAFSYQGCYSFFDSNDPFIAHRMTIIYKGSHASLSTCRAYAALAQEPYFGVYHGDSCLAGAHLPFITAFPANPLSCFWPSWGASKCAGNATEYCGGSSAFALYQVDISEDTPPPTPALRGSPWVGCFYDQNLPDVSKNLLAGGPSVSSVASIDECAGNYSALNVTLPAYMAVEGSLCYFTYDLTLAMSLGNSTDCVYPCPGDASQKCGAYQGAFSLYDLSFTAVPTPPTTFSPTPPTTRAPSNRPTGKPTHLPSASPVAHPTARPWSHAPTLRPSSASPTLRPSNFPTSLPTSTSPTQRPTGKPTIRPSTRPTVSG